MEASFNRFISFDIQKGEHDAEDDRHIYRNRHHDDYDDDYDDEYIEDLSNYGLNHPQPGGATIAADRSERYTSPRTAVNNLALPGGGEEIDHEGSLVS